MTDAPTPLETVLGFTGSQAQPSVPQVRAMLKMLSAFAAHRPHVFVKKRVIGTVHHGDCIGSDAAFHAAANLLGYPIVIHPPTDPAKRAWCTGSTTEILPEAPYLVRNHAIVDASDWLLALPSSMTEQLRSGTWATVRYARKQGKPVHIIYSDGSVETNRA